MERLQNRSKLLVTGASGNLGWTLCRMTARTWETYGTVYRHPADLPEVNMHKVDLTDASSVIDLFRMIRPDAVVHAAALSNPDYCQQHPDESEAINVAAAKHIASQCAEFGIPCVFTSSDLIFDGEHAPYNEEFAANPSSIYGQHKLRAEEAMRVRYPNTTICRLPLLFGVGGPATRGPFERMLQAMGRGHELRLFIDEIRTPVSTAIAAQGLMLALQKAQGRTIHLGGSERISRWEMGRIAAEVFFLENARLLPCRQKDVATPSPRPRDVSLDSSRAAKLGYQPQAVRKQMQNLKTAM